MQNLRYFVGSFGFLPHMGEEIEDPFDYDYPFLHHAPDASEDDFEDYSFEEDDFEDFSFEEDDGEDCLDSLLRAAERSAEERKARIAFLVGISTGILSLIFIKLLQRQFKH